MVSFSEIDQLALRDMRRKDTRLYYRNVWRNHEDPYKRRAVYLSECGYGANFIAAACGIEFHQAIRLVTGE